MMTYVENLATQSNANIKDVSELYCVASKFGSKSIVCVTDNMQNVYLNTLHSRFCLVAPRHKPISGVGN